MKSKAPLMLMEQMIMLLVFAVAAALCIQGFVKSADISDLSKARDMAVIEAQNTAEAVRNGSEEDYFIEKGALFTEEGGTINYDKNWNPVYAEEFADSHYDYENPLHIDFYLQLSYTESGFDNLISADIAVYTIDGKLLFSIPASRQVADGASDADNLLHKADAKDEGSEAALSLGEVSADE